MNKKILIGIVILISITMLTFFILMNIENTNQKHIMIRLSTDEPENTVNLSQNDLVEFPYLREALNNLDEHIDIPRNEWDKLSQFFLEKDTHYFNYFNNSYKIYFATE